MWLPISVRDGEEKTLSLKMKDLCGGWWEMLLEKKNNLILREKTHWCPRFYKIQNTYSNRTDVTNYIVPGLEAKVKSAS